MIRELAAYLDTNAGSGTIIRQQAESQGARLSVKEASRPAWAEETNIGQETPFTEARVEPAGSLPDPS